MRKRYGGFGDDGCGMLQSIDTLLEGFEAGSELVEGDGKIIHDSTRRSYFLYGPIEVADCYTHGASLRLRGRCSLATEAGV